MARVRVTKNGTVQSPSNGDSCLQGFGTTVCWGILGEIYLLWILCHFQSLGTSPAASPKIEQNTTTFVCNIVTSADVFTFWDTHKNHQQWQLGTCLRQPGVPRLNGSTPQVYLDWLTWLTSTALPSWWCYPSLNWGNGGMTTTNRDDQVHRTWHNLESSWIYISEFSNWASSVRSHASQISENPFNCLFWAPSSFPASLPIPESEFCPHRQLVSILVRDNWRDQYPYISHTIRMITGVGKYMSSVLTSSNKQGIQSPPNTWKWCPPHMVHIPTPIMPPAQLVSHRFSYQKFAMYVGMMPLLAKHRLWWGWRLSPPNG